MATPLENLLTRRQEITDELAAITSSTTTKGSFPNSTGDGVNIDHQTYKMNLYRELSEIANAIGALEGPIEVISRGDV